MKLFSFFKTRTSSSSRKPSSTHLKIISNTTESDGGKSAAVVDPSSCCSPEEVRKESVGELVEMASKALKSNRLIFQPCNTSSILKLPAARYEFNNCENLDIDSEDPYLDFRNSMEEMVEAYGIKRWEHLEELLALYLRMNRKKNHGVIVAAFIDIFATISTSSFSNCNASSSSKNQRFVGGRG